MTGSWRPEREAAAHRVEVLAVWLLRTPHDARVLRRQLERVERAMLERVERAMLVNMSNGHNACLRRPVGLSARTTPY